MTEVPSRRVERRSRQRAANRAAILDAARDVAAREGAGTLSLRAVAARAGYAPASVYEYFRNRAELVLALAAEDLAQIARTLRETGGPQHADAAAGTALSLLRQSGSLAAAAATLAEGGVPPEAARVFNGRLIGALTALADAAHLSRGSRAEQADVVLATSLLAGLAVLQRTGCLDTLGFAEDELIARFMARFSQPLGR